MNVMSASDVAEAADDGLDEVVYRISHDLRASVRALHDLPNWLREDLCEQNIELDDGARGVLDLIQSHARRLDHMLNGLLEFSRVGRLQELVTRQPKDIFVDVLSELESSQGMEIEEQFNPVEIRMGHEDLRRIFRILLSNAFRHGKGIVHRVEVSSCRSGDFWELLVSDNGPGINDTSKAEVVKPMVKLISRDEDEGGGMGLAVLSKIAEFYAGSLHIEDRRRAGGVTFRLRLPVVV